MFRLLLILFSVLWSTAYAQNVSISGRTKDCFAGKTIYPAQVDVYVINPSKSPAIVSLLKTLDETSPQGNSQDVEPFFATYQKLISTLRKEKRRLKHVRSDSRGRFMFHGLVPGETIILAGVAEREDEPAYYTHMSLKLNRGENLATLDFDHGESCKSEAAPPGQT
jgi:hypothetical protein